MMDGLEGRWCVPSCSAVACLLLAATAGSSSAGIRHYDIESELAPRLGTLRATVALTIVAPETGLTQVELLLNHSLNVRSVTSDVGVKSFHFDRTEKTDYRYCPTAAPLRVELAEPVAPGQEVVIRLDYAGRIDADAWGTNVLTAEWVELASYAAWYPHDPSSKAFTYSLRVKTAPDYAVAGPGALVHAGETWTLTQNVPTSDVVFVSAANLRSRHVDDASSGVDVFHVGSRISDQQIERFAGDVSRMISTFRGWYGPVAGSRLTIVFAERKSGGGYYRPGFMSLLFDDDYRGLVKYAAHEVAHFWWGRADATTWEDWLNESFAEYSSLALMRSWYGPDLLQTAIANYEREAAAAPPIWGLNRNDEAAFVTLYRRGPVLLNRLETRIGEESFRRFGNALVAGDVRSTSALLAKLEGLTSREVRDALERDLRAR